ncbi:MAG: hypothetical protein ACPF8V_10360, partial [Luteibaculum sp.]
QAQSKSELKKIEEDMQADEPEKKKGLFGKIGLFGKKDKKESSEDVAQEERKVLPGAVPAEPEPKAETSKAQDKRNESQDLDSNKEDKEAEKLQRKKQKAQEKLDRKNAKDYERSMEADQGYTYTDKYGRPIGAKPRFESDRKIKKFNKKFRKRNEQKLSRKERKLKRKRYRYN